MSKVILPPCQHCQYCENNGRQHSQNGRLGRKRYFCQHPRAVYLQVKTADGEQQKVDYYAKNAILLSNGTLLLYTQDGYGLVAVTL